MDCTTVKFCFSWPLTRERYRPFTFTVSAVTGKRFYVLYVHISTDDPYGRYLPLWDRSRKSKRNSERLEMTYRLKAALTRHTHTWATVMVWQRLGTCEEVIVSGALCSYHCLFCSLSQNAVRLKWIRRTRSCWDCFLGKSQHILPDTSWIVTDKKTCAQSTWNDVDLFHPHPCKTKSFRCLNAIVSTLWTLKDKC